MDSVRVLESLAGWTVRGGSGSGAGQGFADGRRRCGDATSAAAVSVSPATVANWRSSVRRGRSGVKFGQVREG